MSTAQRNSKIPIPVVAWLANLVFVAIPIVACLLVLKFVVAPPRSLGEALFESHKVVLVAAVTLSGVTLVEGFLLAVKLGPPAERRNVLLFLVCGMLLLSCLAFSIIFYLLALVNGEIPGPRGEDANFF